VVCLSLKRVLETLEGFGLSQSDAKVYVFLAKKGPHTEKNLSNVVNMPKHQLYQCLRNLRNRGIVSVTPERPATFSAVSFEEALDLLVKAKLKEVQRSQQSIHEALSDWQSMFKKKGVNLQTKS
jgi:sugar-specific transcriptional regulator TrmB